MRHIISILLAYAFLNSEIVSGESFSLLSGKSNNVFGPAKFETGELIFIGKTKFEIHKSKNTIMLKSSKTGKEYGPVDFVTGNSLTIIESPYFIFSEKPGAELIAGGVLKMNALMKLPYRKVKKRTKTLDEMIAMVGKKFKEGPNLDEQLSYLQNLFQEEKYPPVGSFADLTFPDNTDGPEEINNSLNKLAELYLDTPVSTYFILKSNLFKTNPLPTEEQKKWIKNKMKLIQPFLFPLLKKDLEMAVRNSDLRLGFIVISVLFEIGEINMQQFSSIIKIFSRMKDNYFLKKKEDKSIWTISELKTEELKSFSQNYVLRNYSLIPRENMRLLRVQAQVRNVSNTSDPYYTKYLSGDDLREIELTLKENMPTRFIAKNFICLLSTTGQYFPCIHVYKDCEKLTDKMCFLFRIAGEDGLRSSLIPQNATFKINVIFAVPSQLSKLKLFVLGATKQLDKGEVKNVDLSLQPTQKTKETIKEPSLQKTERKIIEKEKKRQVSELESNNFQGLFRNKKPSVEELKTGIRKAQDSQHLSLASQLRVERIKRVKLDVKFKKIIGENKKDWIVQTEIRSRGKTKTRFLKIDEMINIDGKKFKIIDIAQASSEQGESIILQSLESSEKIIAFIGKSVYEPKSKIYLKNIVTGKSYKLVEGSKFKLGNKKDFIVKKIIDPSKKLVRIKCQDGGETFDIQPIKEKTFNSTFEF